MNIYDFFIKQGCKVVFVEKEGFSTGVIQLFFSKE